MYLEERQEAGYELTWWGTSQEASLSQGCELETEWETPQSGQNGETAEVQKAWISQGFKKFVKTFCL
jgi:hypothetical protein